MRVGKSNEMSTALTGKVVVLTGAAKRIGAAVAEDLARAGARIVINYRNSRGAAESLVDRLTRAGAEALAVGGDLAEAGEAARLLEQTLQHFGRVDALIANASTFHRTPLAGLTDEQWDEAVTNNLTVAALPAIHFGRWMKEHEGGTIITLADVAGLRPWRDYLPYSVGKAGVIALTRGLAKELAPEVRVNAVAPGPILFPDDMPEPGRQRELDRTLLKRAGTPAHIAGAIRFLLENDYVTGVLLPVDGGRGLA